MEKGEIRINTENIFPIIKKAVYSDHEIFLRELVSNGVDAISKRRMASMAGDCENTEEAQVKITISREKNTLTISDNGIGFTISVDILRNLIKEEETNKKKILLMFKDSYLLEKGMNEQKIQQKKGNIAVLHLNPCDDLAKANQIMKENNCSEILWIK